MSYFFDFKIILAFIISFGIAYIIGPMLLPMLKKLKFGQTIREDGPASHLVKNGTPTMGGIIFIISVVLTVIISGRYSNEIWFALSFMLLFGLVGFLDDYIKVVLKRSLGLRAYQKIILQFVFAIILAIYQKNTSPMGTQLIVPFFRDMTLDLGILYVPFLVFVIIAITNSVNLTDGLDGLASSITFVVATFFTLMAIYTGYGHLAIFMAAVSGGCVGFLRVNRFPAKVFMGDTGSLALGGALATIAILTKHELSLLLIGGVFVVETLSSAIQIIAIRKFHKKVFLKAPLHHHFEELGWEETDIVKLFWVVGLFLAMIGIIYGVWL